MNSLLNISIFILLGFSACSKKNSMSDIAVKSNLPNAKNQLSYLALGDSYTIGQSVSEQKNFPMQLVNALNIDSIFVKSPTIIAQTGWTTDDLKRAINGANLNPKYDFITLLIGVNNQYRNYNIEIYKTEFKELLQIAINYAGGNAKRVFVISIPDWGVTPYAQNNGFSKTKIASEIDAYNQINLEMTQSSGANYLDITPISRTAESNPNLIANDGLHPSEKMYALWVYDLLKQVNAQIKQ